MDGYSNAQMTAIIDEKDREIDELKKQVEILLRIPTIDSLIRESHDTAKEKGWWDNGIRTFGELIALCHSELSEALEEFRHWGDPTRYYYSSKTPDGFETYTMQAGDLSSWKPEGAPAELADLLIRVFDLCGHYKIDLAYALEEKMEHNKHRPTRHGGKHL